MESCTECSLSHTDDLTEIIVDVAIALRLLDSYIPIKTLQGRLLSLLDLTEEILSDSS